MSTPAELYTGGIKKKLKNYYAAWLPNELLAALEARAGGPTRS